MAFIVGEIVVVLLKTCWYSKCPPRRQPYSARRRGERERRRRREQSRGPKLGAHWRNQETAAAHLSTVPQLSGQGQGLAVEESLKCPAAGSRELYSSKETTQTSVLAEAKSYTPCLAPHRAESRPARCESTRRSEAARGPERIHPNLAERRLSGHRDRAQARKEQRSAKLNAPMYLDCSRRESTG